MPGLREDILSLLSSATFILLQYVVEYMLGDKKKIWPPNAMLEKMHSCTFSENHGYSLMLHQNWTRVVSDKSVAVGRAAISRSFSRFVTLNTLFHRCLLYLAWISYPCVISLENTGSPCMRRNGDPFHQTLSKPHICKYPHWSHQKNLSVWGSRQSCQAHLWHVQVFWNCHFCLQAWILSLAQNIVRCFSFLKCQAHCVHFWEHVFWIPKAEQS